MFLLGNTKGLIRPWFKELNKEGSSIKKFYQLLSPASFYYTGKWSTIRRLSSPAFIDFHHFTPFIIGKARKIQYQAKIHNNYILLTIFIVYKISIKL